MAAVDPNNPGFYVDGTPIPGYTQRTAQSINPAPASNNRVAAMQAELGENQPKTLSAVQPIQKQGNPYNNPKKPIYITADNQIADTAEGITTGKGKTKQTNPAYTYYGVPTLGLRTQINAQNEFKQRMEQWAQEFAEQQRQNKFGEGIAEGTLTGYYNGRNLGSVNPATGKRTWYVAGKRYTS